MNFKKTYLESFDKEKKDLKNKHDAELETVNAEVDRLTDENEKNQSDLENMTAQVNQAKEESSKKEAEAAKAKADADKAKSELEKQSKAHQNLLDDIKKKNEQVEKMKGLLKDKVGEIVEKSKEVNSLTDQLGKWLENQGFPVTGRAIGHDTGRIHSDMPVRSIVRMTYDGVRDSLVKSQDQFLLSIFSILTISRLNRSHNHVKDQLKTDSEQQQARISQLESESDEATEGFC